MTGCIILLVLAPLAAIAGPFFPPPHSYALAAISLLLSACGILALYAGILRPLRRMACGEKRPDSPPSPIRGLMKDIEDSFSARTANERNELELARAEMKKLREDKQECREIISVAVACQDSMLQIMKDIHSELLTLDKKLHEANCGLHMPQDKSTGARTLKRIDEAISSGESYLGRINSFIKNIDSLSLDVTEDDDQPLVQWQESYSVGIAAIDKQHKMLLSYINQLHRSIHNGGDTATLLEILDALAGYAFTHFSTEEIFFANSGYPQAEAHTRVHREFEQKVIQFREAVLDKKAHVDVTVLEFLKEWLLEHIQKMDAGITGYVAEHRKDTDKKLHGKK